MLTKEEIERIRSVGRDEIARSASVGLAELDALCATAAAAIDAEARLAEVGRPWDEPIEHAALELLAVACMYGEACDSGNYARLNILVRDMKECARRYHWRTKGINGDPRPQRANGATIKGARVGSEKRRT